jgi:hypothetical protein
MEKLLKDYAHLYLGCEVIAPHPQEDGKQLSGYLTGIHGEHEAEVQHYEDGYAWEHPEYHKFKDVILKLRHPTSMSEEESDEWNSITESGSRFPTLMQSAKEIKYFLSRGIDLFGLIEDGLAVDKNNLTQ